MKTLKGKMSSVFIGLVLLIGIIGTSSVATLIIIEKVVDGLMTDNYKSISALGNMLEAIERQDSAIHIFIGMDSQSGIVMFNQNRSIFQKWHSIEINNITESGEKEIVSNISDSYDKYLECFSLLQETKNSKSPEAAIKYYNTRINPVFLDIKKGLKELIQINEQAMFSDKKHASRISRISIYFVLVFSLFSVVFGFVTSRYFTNLFLTPLRLLEEGIRKVKGDELDHHIEIKTNDEISTLAIEFNEMTTRLKQYEKSSLGKLLTEKNKSVTLVKSIPDPLLMLDNNYRITLINNASEEIFGISESNALQKHFLEAIRNGEIFDHIISLKEFGVLKQDKIISIPKDDVLYFNVIVTAFIDADSNPSGWIVLFQDITKLKELEKIKTDFIASISHEFKTPLTSILLGAEMLENENFGEITPEQREVLAAIKEDGEKLSALVIDMLELIRVESKKAVYDFKLCSINSIIQNSLKPFIELAKKKDVCILTKFDDTNRVVYADFEKISWVVNNLMSNALKHTHASDTISVIAYSDSKQMYVSIRDTGDGIPAEIIDKIFDKFMLAQDREIGFSGAGFGLSLSREIVNAHKGNISVISQEGSGSTFTFTLPIAHQEEEFS